VDLSDFTYTGIRAYRAGDYSRTVHEYLHNRTGMEFVLIPGGEFWQDCESPIQAVFRTQVKPFLMAKYPCTQGQWGHLMKYNPGFPRENDKPVNRVCWYEAMDFCRLAGLRLPVSAEWEYACRAGSSTRYYFGSDERELNKYAWHRGNTRELGHVGWKRPNAFGLCDMLGNVWEWCQDKMEHLGNVVNDLFLSPRIVNYRKLHGGSYSISPRLLNCAAVRAGADLLRDQEIGFRCACSVEM